MVYTMVLVIELPQVSITPSLIALKNKNETSGSLIQILKVMEIEDGDEEKRLLSSLF